MMPPSSNSPEVNAFQFYNELQHSRALISAFNVDGGYTLDRASSIPAAYLANNIPLVSHALVQTYGYLHESAVLLRHDSENEAEAMLRICKWTKEEILAHKRAAPKWKSRAYQENEDTVEGIVKHFRHMWETDTDFN